MKIEAIINTKGRAQNGLADIHIRTEEGLEHQLDLPFRGLYERCGLPSPLALDLVLTASICYVVDKTVSRTSARDGWTRDLKVSIPVSAPTRWARVAKALAETLTFLTGDDWHLSFYKSPEPLFISPKGKALPLPPPTGNRAACLLSGGLDSLAGAIDLLSDESLDQVLLIGHYDSPGPRKVQAALAVELIKKFPGRLAIEHVRVAHRPEKADEETMRSRSFVFVALGLYGAQAFGPKTPLYMYENGFIALNVPLTPSRRGSCSTRTMHPYYLERLQEVIAALGISNKIVNPYALKTKGECVAECQNPDLLASLADTSVSCSHSSRRQDWVRKKAKNCGYCVPCICRRASLYKVGLDVGKQYGRDITAGEMDIEDRAENRLERGNDLRAITDFLQFPLTPEAMSKRLLAVSPLPELAAYADLACRGFNELKTLITTGKTKSASKTHA